ncbi:MAG: glucose 1-dehydrogenase [Syntrophorhabdaceae bacterium]|nr:glucose 1-dehydrogenase [Syntrophorhabdaceae bacterium]
MGVPIFSLSGEIAIVTGGRRGIGRAIAIAFAEAGADVIVADKITEDGELANVSNEIIKLGRQSMAIRVDTSVKADVENMVREVMERFGRIDILLNNAGILIRSTLLDMPEDVWDTLMDVDLKGYFLCAQAVGREMVKKGGGSIINIATQFAFKVTQGMGGYSIAKAGVVMLTRALAQELGRYNIRVNAIAPGLIRTDFSKPSWTDRDFLRQYEASVPLGRIGEPSDLIGAALYLATNNLSSYVTGQTLVVDGGALA